MKKVAAGVVAGVLLFALAGFSYSATRTSSAVTPAQFKALQKRVTKLEKLSGALASYTASCLFDWQGIKQFGDGSTTGYVYHDTSGDVLTSALDYPESGGAPDGWVPFTKTQACTAPSSSVIAALRAAPRLRHLSRR
jgi:hypothetical protein